MARRKTRFTGVYERTSSTRKFQGKPDIAYDYAIKIQGRLSWKCAGWRSEGMTAAAASDARADAIRQSKVSGSVVMTMDQAWDLYYRDWLREKKSAGTDAGVYRHHVQPVIGSVRIADVTSAMVTQIMNEMGELSSQTKKHALGLIKRVFRKMQVWGLYDGKDPTIGIQSGRIDNRRMRYLTRAEAKTLLLELDRRSPLVADICRVSLYAGLRLGEIRALKVQHVDLSAGIISVMDAKAGSRQTVINDSLREVLERRTKYKAPGDYLFSQEDGTQLKYLSHVFTRVVRDLGFNEGVDDERHKVVFHSLRHTFASWLVQGGVPLYTVADLMGHSTITMTQRYAKLAQDDRREAVKLIGKIV